VIYSTIVAVIYELFFRDPDSAFHPSEIPLVKLELSIWHIGFFELFTNLSKKSKKCE
jgi:hypothetical protein